MLSRFRIKPTMKNRRHQNENRESTKLESQPSHHNVVPEFGTLRIAASLHGRTSHLADETAYVNYDVDFGGPAWGEDGVVFGVENADEPTQCHVDCSRDEWC